MKIEKIKISELKVNPINPRTSTKEQEDNLKRSLEKFGVVEPIIYNKRSGQIVGGHFRVRELKKLGVKEVDCVIVDLDEKDENELNIRLNANTGDWNIDILRNDWNSEDLEEWGVDVDFDDKIDNSIDEEIIHFEKSLQIIPKKEYILIMADQDSEDWQELKELFKCKMVRQGGCKIGSTSDKATTGLERVFDLKTLKERLF